MIIYKPLNLKFSNRLEAKRYFGHTEFNKLIKNPDNFEFINNNAIAKLLGVCKKTIYNYEHMLKNL